MRAQKGNLLQMTKKIGTMLFFAIALVTPVDARAASLLGCFARAYDKDHLAQHLDQIVTAVKLKIYPSPSDPTANWFDIQMQKRGEYKALHNEGYCKADGDTTTCYIECDGGGVRVTPRSNSTILMRLGVQPPFGPDGKPIGQEERIRMTPCGTTDNDDGNGTEVTGGKDDHVFLLNRVDDSVCVGIDQ